MKHPKVGDHWSNVSLHQSRLPNITEFTYTNLGGVGQHLVGPLGAKE